MVKTRRCIWMFLMTLLISALWSLFPVTAHADLVSKPGEYEGYAKSLYKDWARTSEHVAVSDGTRLAVDIYRPTDNGQPVKTPLPVIFIFTPYGRSAVITDKEGNVTTNLRGKPVTMYTPVSSYGAHGGLVSLTNYGYVIACADVRGLGASYGARAAANNRTEANDAHDLIEWLGTQNFCDGNVAMWGASYFGQTVLEAVETMPPHLKAVYFGVTNWNFYDAWSRGGIVRGSAGEVAPDPAKEVKRTIPVDWDIDGDGDGYPDMLWEAVNEHLNNGPFTGLVRQLPYRDSLSELYEEGEAAYWEENSASNYMEEIAALGVPAYIFGSWYDFLRRDTIMTFVNWPNPAKLLLTQGAHGDSIILPKEFNQLAEIHRFFDYWLKGVDNGVMDEPPVYYTTVSTPITVPGLRKKIKTNPISWQFASQWPPHNTNSVDFYLHEGPSKSAPSVNDGSLAVNQPQSETAKDDYQADYSITTNVEPLLGAMVPSGAEFDQKGLTYTTRKLTADTTIDGLPTMTLWVSSDNKDADFMVILEDVAPNGDSYYVSDGRLRASLREVNTPPYDFLGLPWHRAYAEDERKLSPGEIVKLEITMMPTSYLFKRGHRIRLAVVCSHGLVFNLDPETDEDAPDLVSVYRDKNHQSHLTLPIAAHANVCRGNLTVNSQGLEYEGPAELYLGSKAVYIGYGDRWIKWGNIKYSQKQSAESYQCDGELGQLKVTLNKKFNGSSEVIAKGPGISFQGSAGQ